MQDEETDARTHKTEPRTEDYTGECKGVEISAYACHDRHGAPIGRELEITRLQA